jgi:predicted transcriptional regulator
VKGTSAKTLAFSGWGEVLPEWVETLAEACDRSSMRTVAASLGVSPALVSLAVRNAHHARLDFIQRRVEAVLSGVECPVLGHISAERCHHNQNQPFLSINPLVVRLYRACHGECPYGGSKNGQ